MFLRYREETNQQTKRVIKFGVFSCDATDCEKEYELSLEKTHNKKRRGDTYTFCSRSCAQKEKRSGGKTDILTKESNLKKYGFETPSKNEEIKSKINKTNQERYGVDYPCQSKQIQDKVKETNLKNIGVEYPFQSNEIQDKVKITVQEKYGVTSVGKLEEVQEKMKETNISRYGQDNVLKIPEFREKIKETLMEKYGVENSLLSEEVMEKRNATNFERFGHINPFGNKEIQNKIKKTNIEKYGFKNPVSNIETQRKVHQSRKKNGSYGKSKSEDNFYETFLLLFLLFDDIERQAIVKNWPIDFYIKSLNLYIQFDGVYYHGLDRLIEVIKEFKTTMDEAIYKHHLNDQEQNKYFKENSLKLLRISDHKFSEMQSLNQEQELFNQIQEFASGKESLLILH